MASGAGNVSAEPVYAVGVDLAWSRRNRSGLAALRYDPDSRTATLTGQAWLRTDAEIAAWVAKHAPADSPAVIGIDAPLTVPNLTGSRPGDKALSAAYRRFQAGAYPANRRLLSRYNDGTPRGEVILAALATQGIAHTPNIPTRGAVRAAFEVYPHAALVGLFGLTRTLKYKRGSAVQKAAALRELARYMAKLSELEPSLAPFDPLPVDDMPHKQAEDCLDALLCAYFALYYWYWGAAKCRIFGEAAGGYIVAPHPPQ